MEAHARFRPPARSRFAAVLVAFFVVVPVSVASAAPPPEAAAKKLEGDRLRDAGDVDGARRAYDAAVALDPTYAEALSESGSLAFAAGDITTALARFRAAIAADPRYALAHYNLGYALRKAGAFREAAEAYRSYVTLAPHDPDGYYGLGESLRGAGDRVGAISAYEQYVARERRESEREYVEKSEQLLAQLRAQVEEARTMPPPAEIPAGGDRALALQKMQEGDALAAARRPREALFAYQDAVAADPDNADGLYRLGLGYATLGHYPEAAEKWRATIQSPRASAAVRSLATANLKKVQELLGVNAPIPTGPAPAAAPAPVAAAPVAAAPGTVPPAAADAAAEANARYQQGNQLYQQRRFTEAIAAYGAAIALRPDHAYAYLGRANAYLAAGSLVEARRDAEAAVRLAPQVASPLLTLGMILERQGDRAGAAARYREYAASAAADATAAMKEAAGRRAAALAP
jgi:tetratricopeptide (TPR) repeat protein